jgi:site-specific DNA-methyltransferase (adenine-specific)
MSVTVLRDDCRAAVSSMPDEFFDLVIADPPYGDTSLAWDRDGEPLGWRVNVRRVLKRTGSLWVFSSMRAILADAEWADWKFAQDIVWEKQNGSSMAADRFRRVHEHVLQFYRDDAPWGDVWNVPQFTNDATKRTARRKERPSQWGAIDGTTYVSEDGGPRLMRSVQCIQSMHGEAIHPTQKPEELIRILIETSCPPGGTVLDPFGGSGTTGLVAQRLGRSAVLIEKDAKYADAARARIAADAPLFNTETP